MYRCCSSYYAKNVTLYVCPDDWMQDQQATLQRNEMMVRVNQLEHAESAMQSLQALASSFQALQHAYTAHKFPVAL